MFAATEEHLARELRLMRGTVEETNALIRVQVLPAIDGLDNRIGALEVRVDDLESSRPTQPRPAIATPASPDPEPPLWWALAGAALASVVFALLFALITWS